MHFVQVAWELLQCSTDETKQETGWKSASSFPSGTTAG
jgi:hypothetical protein